MKVLQNIQKRLNKSCPIKQIKKNAVARLELVRAGALMERLTEDLALEILG